MHHHARLLRSSTSLAIAAAVLLATGCASRAPDFVPPSRPAQFSFAGIPWGIGPDSVITLLEPRGYNYNHTDEDGDLWFDGILLRAPTRVYAFMSEERLVKFRVMMGTPDEDALSTYRSARAELIKQYGTPTETVEDYTAPFRQGDGKEQEAVRAGKADIHTYWRKGEGARAMHVSLQVTDNLAVAVDYDGPAWQRESVRRRRER